MMSIASGDFASIARMRWLRALVMVDVHTRAFLDAASTAVLT